MFDSRSGKGETETLTYSDYAPYSWFEITVRNKNTGEVYLQDGFGREKGYGIIPNATLKVLKRDDMLIEFHGNNITATSSIWVKPVGNVDNPENNTYAECKYWESNPQNSLSTADCHRYSDLDTGKYKNNVTLHPFFLLLIFYSFRRFTVNYLSDENNFSKAGSKSRVPVG